jgi:Na+-driven multidrug efflux pump
MYQMNWSCGKSSSGDLKMGTEIYDFGGAGKPDRAERSAWLATGLLEGFITLVIVAMLIWTKPVVHIFSSDLNLESTAVQYIHVATVGWIMIGFNFVLMNCLQSAGDTLPPMIISIITPGLLPEM